MRPKILHWVLIALLGLAATPALAESSIDAKSAFERLSALAGTWNGTPDASGLKEVPADEPPPPPAITHAIQVSANGSVVMETMNPGTDHEMINMYHLDGEELVLTHYCAGGNQPTMKLDRAKSTADRFIFDFTGGSNLDPEVDNHIHNAELIFDGDDKMESRWSGYSGGVEAGVMVFHLERITTK